MVVQNVSADGRQTDLTFTIKNEDIKKTEKLLRNNKKIKFQKILIKRNVSKISIIGVGMITTPIKVIFVSFFVNETPVIILLAEIFFFLVINVPGLLLNDDLTSIFILFNLAS